MRYNLTKYLSDLIAWILVLFIVASCSSPEKLIDKAVKRDPSILKQYTDTVSLTMYRVDSLLINVGDTVYYEKYITEYKYDTIIPYDRIEIERKKTRLEIRKSAKIESKRLKLESKLKRLQERNGQDLLELEAKYQLKIDKLNARLKAKEQRQDNRQQSKERRSNKFWLGFLIGSGSTVLLYLAFRLFIGRLISTYDY